MRITKKIISVLLTLALVLSVSAATVSAIDEKTVTYYIGSTAVKTVNVSAGDSYTFENINLNSDEYKHHIPEGYYFTGWYTDAACTQPVRTADLTKEVTVTENMARYACVRPYETEFSPVAYREGTWPSSVEQIIWSYYAVQYPHTRGDGSFGNALMNRSTGAISTMTNNGTDTIISTPFAPCEAIIFHDANGVAYQAKPDTKYIIKFHYKYSGLNGATTNMWPGVGLPKSSEIVSTSASIKLQGYRLNNSANHDPYSAGTPLTFDAEKEGEWIEYTAIVTAPAATNTTHYPIFFIRNNAGISGTVEFKNIKVQEYIPEPVSVVYNYLDKNGEKAQRVVDKGVSLGDNYAIDFLAPNTKDKYFVDWYTSEDYSGEPVSTATININSDGAKHLYAKYEDYPATAELILPGNGTTATKVNMPIITNAEFGSQETDKIDAYGRMVNSSVPFIKSSTYEAETNSTLFEVGDGATSSAHILTDKNGNFVAAKPGATYKMTVLAKSSNGATRLTFGASIPRTHFQLFFGDPQWYRAPNNNSGYNELLHKSGEVTIDATENYEKYSLVFTMPENISDEEYNFLGLRITNAAKGGSVSVKDIFVYEIDTNAKEEMFVSFENYIKFSKNAVLDETNNYAIAQNTAEHTVWQNANQDGVWANPIKQEKIYTVFGGSGFAPENFAIVDGGMESEKALKFKQTVSGTKYKVADISNGVLLKDNTTYTATFYYKAEGESNKDLEFGIANALNSEILGTINKVVIPANEVASNWTKVTLTFTTDFGYHNADYAISSEMFCIPVLCVNCEIDDTDRTVYIDNVSLETSINCGGVSVLKAEEETVENAQALRVYFNYLPNENGEITIGGESVSVVKRGVLLTTPSKLNKKTDENGNFIRDMVETPNIFVKENAEEYRFVVSEKAENLADCWANENGVLTYSTYIKNFEVNDENQIAVRGYIELSDGRTIYSDIYTYSVSEVKAVNALGNEKTYYDFTKAEVTEKLVLQGNSKVIETGITADWSGQTVKFKANCIGDVTVKVHNPLGTEVRFKVLVDGARVTGEFRPAGVDSENGISEFTFNVGNKPGIKEIQISRITEVIDGPTEIMGAEFIGELVKAEQAETLIEFIGDSITCGTGGGGEGVHDGTRTYAFLTAQRLGFDFRIRSRSGSGFKTSSGGSVGIGYSWPETYGIDSYIRSETTPYSINKEADVVCIYLGTNDSAAAGSKPTEERNAYFVDGMKNLVSIVKQYNPNAKFVWITGGMTNGYKDAAITAMNDLGGEANGYYVCQLPNGLNAGGAGHPTYDQHAQMADVFANFLTEKGLVK